MTDQEIVDALREMREIVERIGRICDSLEHDAEAREVQR
jgi:hypothetical protein